MTSCRSIRSRTSRRSRRYSLRRTCWWFIPTCLPKPWRSWSHWRVRNRASSPTAMPASARRRISPVFVAANLLVVHPDVPAKTLAELVSLARAQPGKLTYGHAGIGTSQHLAGELFKYMAHIDVTPVAYRGSTAVLPDILAGRLTMFFGNIVNVLPQVREGKLRAFAITSLKRSALAPDLPTMAESGFPGFEAVPWFGLLAPAGTPADIIDKIYKETVKDLALPDVHKSMEQQGLDSIGNTPAEFAAAIKTETPRWAKVIKDAGIKLSN